MWIQWLNDLNKLKWSSYSSNWFSLTHFFLNWFFFSVYIVRRTFKICMRWLQKLSVKISINTCSMRTVEKSMSHKRYEWTRTSTINVQKTKSACVVHIHHTRRQQTIDKHDLFQPEISYQYFEASSDVNRQTNACIRMYNIHQKLYVDDLFGGTYAVRNSPWTHHMLSAFMAEIEIRHFCYGKYWSANVMVGWQSIAKTINKLLFLNLRFTMFDWVVFFVFTLVFLVEPRTGVDIVEMPWF